MADSGRRVDLSGLPGIKVGKHSTGGVGDKVSIVLAPLVAACGVIVPKMSGRGLGHTGGTLDKLEAIPGFRTALSLDQFLTTLARGRLRHHQPDRGCRARRQEAVRACRDVTATIESLPLICASVMSKKIAEGSDALVLDVKAGRGAFMKTVEEALALARALVSIGEAAGSAPRRSSPAWTHRSAVRSAMPSRSASASSWSRGRDRADLIELIVRLADAHGRGRWPGGVGRRRRSSWFARALETGAAADKLRAMIAAQGGDPAVVDDPGRLPRATAAVEVVRADRSGVVAGVDAELVGRAAAALGAGRERKDDAVDPAAGVVVVRGVGDTVRAGDPVLELHVTGRPAADAVRPGGGGGRHRRSRPGLALRWSAPGCTPGARSGWHDRTRVVHRRRVAWVTG